MALHKVKEEEQQGNRKLGKKTRDNPKCLRLIPALQQRASPIPRLVCLADLFRRRYTELRYESDIPPSCHAAVSPAWILLESDRLSGLCADPGFLFNDMLSLRRNAENENVETKQLQSCDS